MLHNRLAGRGPATTISAMTMSPEICATVVSGGSATAPTLKAFLPMGFRSLAAHLNALHSGSIASCWHWQQAKEPGDGNISIAFLGFGIKTEPGFDGTCGSNSDNPNLVGPRLLHVAPARIVVKLCLGTDICMRAARPPDHNVAVARLPRSCINRVNVDMRSATLTQKCLKMRLNDPKPPVDWAGRIVAASAEQLRWTISRQPLWWCRCIVTSPDTTGRRRDLLVWAPLPSWCASLRLACSRLGVVCGFAYVA